MAASVVLLAAAGDVCIWVEPLLRAWDDRDRKRAVEIQDGHIGNRLEPLGRT